ncbi:hypothetical protein DFAR_1380018 [Desulfarculales bacterium]
MPAYDYQCNNCEHVFEVWQGIDGPDPDCPLCTCPQVTRLISVAIHTRDDGTASCVGMNQEALWPGTGRGCAQAGQQSC